MESGSMSLPLTCASTLMLPTGRLRARRKVPYFLRMAAPLVALKGASALEPITDPEEALKPDAIQVHGPGTYRQGPNHIETTKFSRGDVEKAFATALGKINIEELARKAEPFKDIVPV